MFKAFASALGHEEWVEDQRFENNAVRVANREHLDPLIEAALAGDSVQSWCQRLAACGVPAGPINSVEQAVAEVSLVEHAHPSGQGVVKSTPLPYRIDDCPRASALPPPGLGQHTEEVLLDWIGDGASVP